MKRIFIVFWAAAILFSGCQNAKSRAVEGATIGGILGAAAGGIIGHQSGHGAEGAAIGAAAGVLTGAVAGSQIEKPAQTSEIPAPVADERMAQAAQQVNPNQMSIQQIAQLAKEGINEDVIIDKIRLTNSKFSLSQEDTEYLTQQGVTQKVIDAMQSN